MILLNLILDNMAQSNDPKKPQGKQVKILSKPLAMVVDGHGIKLNNSMFGELFFFQISDQTKETIEVRGIANIRMTISQFKELKDAIDSLIKDHEKKVVQKGN